VGETKPKPHYHGHRDRLRARFAEGGISALADYELLELYLFRSIPRKDVKPIAKDLIAKFGSFAETIAAPVERLTEVKGISEKIALDLKILKAAATKLGQADEVLGQGTIDRAPVYPREIIKRALELESTALILTHNHPSGDPTPSQSDIDMTKEIVQACKAIRVSVHDHLIIGRENIASFKTLGLM